jgi:hypothetical protein
MQKQTINVRGGVTLYQQWWRLVPVTAVFLTLSEFQA